MKIEKLSDNSAEEVSRVTQISPSIKNPNRANISINQKYFCSLDLTQIVELKLKVNQTLSPQQLENLRQASELGKLYIRTVEYIALRPRSRQEVQTYLRQKTQPRLVRTRNPQTGHAQTTKKSGYEPALIPLVIQRLETKNLIDDAKFTQFWIEQRLRKRGISRRRLEQELSQKGINRDTIQAALTNANLQESDQIQAIITKKRHRYDDQKLIQYLMRQGFDYESAKTAVLETDSQN